MLETVKITTDYITLGQFLKLTGIIDSGSLAKIFLLDNKVLVNGELETRRGRKLYPEYQISILGHNYVIKK